MPADLCRRLAARAVAAHVLGLHQLTRAYESVTCICSQDRLRHDTAVEEYQLR